MRVVLNLLYYKLRVVRRAVMDLGEDAALSARYAREHADVLQLLQQPDADLRADSKGPLAFPASELRDHGFYPSALPQTGVKWRKLVRKHGLRALLDYGMDWRSMVACGFGASDLATLTYADAQRLRLTSSDLLEVRPSLSDLSGMRLAPYEFQALGLADWETFKEGLGANASSMRDMKYTLSEWREVLGPSTPWCELGFTETNTCGWNKKQVEEMLAEQPAQAAPAAPVPPPAPRAAPSLRPGSLVF